MFNSLMNRQQGNIVIEDYKEYGESVVHGYDPYKVVKALLAALEDIKGNEVSERIMAIVVGHFDTEEVASALLEFLDGEDDIEKIKQVATFISMLDPISGHTTDIIKTANFKSLSIMFLHFEESFAKEVFVRLWLRQIEQFPLVFQRVVDVYNAMANHDQELMNKVTTDIYGEAPCAYIITDADVDRCITLALSFCERYNDILRAKEEQIAREESRKV